MPSLKQHVGRVIRRHSGIAAILLMIAAILGAVGYQMAAPALGLSASYREKLELFHLLLPLMALGFLVGAVATLARGLFLKARPEHHPVLRRLALYGPPGKVMAEIDGELAREDEVVVLGRPQKSFRLSDGASGPSVYLTRSWLVQLTELGARLVRLDDVLWVWKYVDEGDPRALVGPRPHHVRVVVRRDAHEEFDLPEEDADRLVLWLLRRAPWVRAGWGPDAGRCWHARPEQLDELYEEVMRERRALERQAPAEWETAVRAREEDVKRAERGRDRPSPL